MKKLFKKVILGLLLILCGIALFACTKPGQESEQWKCSITVLQCENGNLTVNKTSITTVEHLTISIIPDEGYRLKEGSLKITPAKSYKLTENAETYFMPTASFMPLRDTTISAEFEKISKTFTYDYQGAKSDTTAKSVTLDYENLDKAIFPVPQRENCKFDGWYLGGDPYGFFAKVSDENGKAIIDTDIFYNRFDTLYARWVAIDGFVYPC